MASGAIAPAVSQPSHQVKLVRHWVSRRVSCRAGAQGEKDEQLIFYSRSTDRSTKHWRIRRIRETVCCAPRSGCSGRVRLIAEEPETEP